MKPDGTHIELAAQSSPVLGGAWGPWGASFTWTYPVSDLGEWDVHIFAHGRRRQAFIWLPFLITEEEYDGSLVTVTETPAGPPPVVPPPPPTTDWLSTLTGVLPLIIGIVLLGLIIPLFK